MPDPKLDEFCRARDFKPSFLRNMQDYCRDVIQQQLDERETLIEENHRLIEENAALKKAAAKPRKTEAVLQ